METIMKRESSIVAQRQEPLRRLFAENVQEAITTKRVRTVHGAGSDPLHGSVVPVGDFPETTWSWGTDHKVGGFGDLPNSGHILCASLAACMDNIIRMIADLLGIALRHLEVEVAGDVDVRGCLAIDSSVRPGFRQISCAVRLRAAEGADPRKVELLAGYAEKLCVTLDTLRNGVPIDVSFDCALKEHLT
jgi:uncharacterized OsmC-like protein